MKIFWVLTALTAFCWGMYDQVREVQRERAVAPMAAAK